MKVKERKKVTSAQPLTCFDDAAFLTL